ncbi:MAG: FAD-dependent oxidoreductase [Chryseolinea sp.]
MKLRSKETYWLLMNGLINTYPSLQKNITCDVLIIGGGITGALMAYQLSGEGYKTVVVDKRDVALGSTSATTAMIQYEIDEPLFSLIKKVGENAAIDSYQGGVAAIDKLEKIIKTIKADCGFERKKSLFIASSSPDSKWLQEEYTCRKANEIDVSWLNQSQLKSKFGVAGEGAILSTAGASLDAYRLTHALLSYCVMHHGLKIYDHTEAESINYDAKNCIVLTDDKNIIKCKHVVHASGYESQSVVKSKIVKLISTYALVSEPVQKLPISLKNTLLWNTEDPYLYLRSTRDNRILVGGGDENFKNPLRRDNLIDKKQKFLMEKAQSLIPALKLIPDFTWAGTFGVTKDSLPYIGSHPDFPNSYFILGFGGNGITFSVMGMSIISDALAGKHNPFLEYFKFNR